MCGFLFVFWSARLLHLPKDHTAACLHQTMPEKFAEESSQPGRRLLIVAGRQWARGGWVVLD